jgi:hypothetical protein
MNNTYTIESQTLIPKTIYEMTINWKSSTDFPKYIDFVHIDPTRKELWYFMVDQTRHPAGMYQYTSRRPTDTQEVLGSLEYLRVIHYAFEGIRSIEIIQPPEFHPESYRRWEILQLSLEQ